MSEQDPPPQEANAAVSRVPNTALSAAHMARVFHQPGLIYFNAVARNLSMRAAARQLNVASSAISRQIGQLETALGLVLFERERQRLHLSPAGEILYRHTKELANSFNTAVSELEMLRGLRTGKVRIATIESVGLSLLPKLIAEFGERHPRIHLDVVVTSSEEVIGLLTREEVDIGFGFIHNQPTGVEVTLRRDVRVGALMKPDHPLAENKSLMLSDCLSHPIAIARPEISLRGIIEPFLQQAGASLPPVVEANSIRMLVQMACLGNYISIMTPIGAQSEIETGQLLFKPLEDVDLPTNRFALLVRTRNNLQFAPAVFYEYGMARFSSINLPGAV